MTSYEIWVVIVLGLVGYWGTSFLINFLKKEPNLKTKKNYSQDIHENQEGYPKKTWHEILEVNSSASLDEIRTAYKRKISMYHPDKVSSMGPEFDEIAQRKSKEINSAYDEAIAQKK